MNKNTFVILCAVWLNLIGYTSPAASPNYFKTDFQDESQFIVEAITSDLAEQIYYARFHHLPEAKNFSVSAVETPDSTFEAPTYELQWDLDAQHRGLKNRLNIAGPIWSPEVYDGFAAQLSQAIGLPAGENNKSTNTVLLAKLTDGTAATIEQENQKLSQALQENFSDAGLHEAAAVLLGAFTLREHSGDFYEIRSPLCRITAHLAMARYLSRRNLSSINGQMAEAMSLTLMNDQAAALEKLREIQTNVPAVASWVRALQARNTGDYRPLDKLNGLSPVECINWFYALDHSANPDVAWSKLSDVQKRSPDFVRIISESGYSVGVGHELLSSSLRGEFSEIADIYQSVHQEKMGQDGLIKALNELPEHCFSPSADGKPEVRIIGWGLWAGFLQRQLCHAVQRNFDFLQRRWGVPEDAHDFSTNCDRTLGGLRLYPFVRRFNSVDTESYHQSVDDGLKVTIATPQLVPAECWNYLYFSFPANESLVPNFNAQANQWYKHNPPPGTVYNSGPRLNQASLWARTDLEALVGKLHERAPYDTAIAHFAFIHSSKRIPPAYEQATNLFQSVLAYSSYAMKTVAKTVRDEPERYEQWLAKAALVDPANYIILGNYFANLKMDGKAMTYYEKANELDPDTVQTSYDADWLVKYYLKHHQKEKARAAADHAAETYSGGGLLAKAEFLEATGDYTGALEWYEKNEERYGDTGPIIAFCIRYKSKTHDTRLDGEVQKRFKHLFPRGIEKISIADFVAPPTNGVVFESENDLLRSVGLRMGDVVVAVYGMRAYNKLQYEYERNTGATDELDLLVWEQQDQHYHEIKAQVPRRVFSVDIGTYSPK